MSEKKVGKRLLTWVLVLVMTLSLLPLNVLADEVNPAELGKVEATKKCSGPDSYGNYTITLTVQGNPVSTTETMTTPANADVVLVVDNSGSMETSVGTRCDEPKSSFMKEEKTFWGTGVVVHTCQECHAKYYEWKFIGISLSDVPEVCTGEKGNISRIEAAKNVSKEFAKSILSYDGNQVAVIGFAHGGRSGGTDENAITVEQELTKNPTAVETAINRMKADGGTNYTAALDKAYTYLNNRSDKDGRPGYVIFISDGAPGLSGESQNDDNWNGSKQAENIKGDGYTLYTVGIALEGPAETYLKNMASADQNEHFINVTGADYEAQLRNTLQEWANKITQTPTTKPAGTNAVLTDLINTDEFEYVAGSASPNLKVEDNKTVTWEIGNIPKDEASVSFKIKPKAGVYGKDILTNDDVYLKYTDATGAEVTMGKNVIGDPTVNIPAPQVTLTFDANGGSWETTANVSPYRLNEDSTKATQAVQKFTSVASISVEPKRAGYEFDGWYLGDDKIDSSLIYVSQNTILVAHWVEIPATTYTVVYKDGLAYNKAFDDRAFPNLSVDADTPDFGSTPTRSGYVFTGWTPAVAQKVKAPEDGSTVIIYTATWEVDNWNSNDNSETGGDGIPDKYQALVKFLPGDPNGEVSGNKITQVITMPKTEAGYVPDVRLGSVEGFEVATTTPKSGFEFNVWTMNEVTDETKDEAETAVTPKDVTVKAGSKTTFFAHFKAIPTTYTVTYTDGVDGKAFKNQQYSAKYDEMTPAFVGTPTREGYKFTGWDPEVDEKVTKDVTYTAQWEANSYTVTYTDGVGGKAFENQTHSAKYNETTPAFNGTPTREGYKFTGWDPEVDEKVTKDVTYTAQWEANSYTVTYTDGVGGKAFENQTHSAKYNETTPAFNGTPTREGYKFTGWDPEVDEKVTKDVTYTAQWEANSYTVTFESNGGSKVRSSAR